MMNDIKFNFTSKILVVGASGSGKSTLAHILSKRFNLTDIELDNLFWKPNWIQSEPEEFRAKIIKAISESKGYVMHGNYNKVRDLTWKNAEIVIWLDYPKCVIFWRVLKRSIFRILKNEPLWSGNKETIKKTFFSKESIILWSWNTYDLRKQQYEELIKNPEFSHVKIIRLKSQKETDSFLNHF